MPFESLREAPWTGLLKFFFFNLKTLQKQRYQRGKGENKSNIDGKERWNGDKGTRKKKTLAEQMNRLLFDI